MSQSRQLQLHIAQMKEIRTILNSMKNMAFMEIHKLIKFHSTQGKALANIEKVAFDFLGFYPYLPITENKEQHICILIGAERGFCGDFNEVLIKQGMSQAFTGLILVGNRLAGRLITNTSPGVIASIAGADLVEEVPTILNRLIDTIDSLQNSSGLLNLTVIYHGSDRIAQRRLLPPFADRTPQTQQFGIAPTLNLSPEQFFSELIDNYLFAVLHEIFYISLTAENHKRLQHLDAAVQHLDEETVTLHRKFQTFRQEEITEEIEVILLSNEHCG
jgi:F-type H+-transporting ATPase subunit gamma